MTTDLAPTDSIIPAELQQVAIEGWEEDAFAVVAGSGFLPRIQYFGANSKPVKARKFPMAHYGLVSGKDELLDLGEDFDAYVYAWRPKAIQFGSNVVVSFQPKTDPEFKRIAAIAAAGGDDCDSAAGPEYLLYIPKIGKFATYHMTNNTAKAEARKVQPQIGKAVTFASKQYFKGKNDWWGPFVKTDTAPTGELPPADKLAQELQRFNNPQPQKSRGEAVEGVEAARPD